MYSHLTAMVGHPHASRKDDGEGVAVTAGYAYLSLSWDEARCLANALSRIVTEEGVDQP